MKIFKNYKPILTWAMLALPMVSLAQTIPTTEAAFSTASNFPTLVGDAMVPSRSNYYRAPGYTYNKNADGSLYLTEGGWGSSMVDKNNVNLIKLITRWNYKTVVRPFPAYVIDNANQRQNAFFRLYTNLKLTTNNPTPSTTTSDLKTLRKATSNETFPYFKSYVPDSNGNLIYNWQTWLYPIMGGQRFLDPKTANANRTMTYNNQAITYRDYNYVTLRDVDTSNDLTANAIDKNFEINLSEQAANATVINARINSLRDKMILTLWLGYAPLAGTSAKPITDLRITGWDDAYNMKYKVWFNGGSAVTPSSNNEYLKIKGANDYFNAQNLAGGDDVRNFNKKFDDVADIAEDMLSGGTEAAVELFGERKLLYNNDIDVYGLMQKTVKLNFRLLTVGQQFSDSKLQQRVVDPAFTFTERLTNHADYVPFGNFVKANINFFHPNDPFALSTEYFIDIKTSRPSIAFDAVNASTTSVYEGVAVEMKEGQNIIPNVNVIITEQSGALLPFQEIESVPQAPVIDATRVRVSLVRKADYDAAVSAASIVGSYDAVNNPMPNNDLPTVTNFSYVTQSDFLANQATISAGEYYIKYDYSSPDSNVQIKTLGAGLGNVFAKSIYRSLKVTEDSSSRINPSLRMRISK